MNENTKKKKGLQMDERLRREQERQKREMMRQEKRLIREANKKLVYAPKKTRRSLGLMCLDPDGVMHFSDGRWMKVYRVEGDCDNLPSLAADLQSRVLFTDRIKNGKEERFLTLSLDGDTYEMVRRGFTADEKCLAEMNIRAMSFEELVNAVRDMTHSCSGNDERISFTYEEFMKKREDLETVFFPSVTEEYDRFRIDDHYGTSLFVMQYPDSCDNSVIRDLKEVEGIDDLVISIGIHKVSPQERALHLKNLERRYETDILDDQVEPFINASIRTSVFGENDEILGTICHKTEQIFLRNGFMIAPGFGDQRESICSQLSLGIKQYGSFRNMTEKALKEFFRREYGHDSDKI